MLSAQVLVALGYALIYGAQESWIADELGREEMTHVYVRALQIGLVGTIVGSLVSGLLAAVALRLPPLVGGLAMVVLAGALAVLMPERNFRPVSVRASTLLRGSAQVLGGQLGSASRAVRAVPGLILLFAATFFLGMWSESFDRLWGDLLLKDIAFPRVLDLRPSTWFSLLACAVAVLALGTTELAGRRTRRLGPGSVTTTLLILTCALALLVVIMGGARLFWVFIAAYLAVSALRPAYEPLVTGWMVVRVESGVRATALSARELSDSAGQIIGGPVIGLIGNLVSIRAALLAGAAALGPVIGLLLAATRQVRSASASAAAGARGSAADSVRPVDGR